MSDLPGYDFTGSVVQQFERGPGQGARLVLVVFEDHANRGRHAYTVQLNLGEIANIGEAESFFDRSRELPALARARMTASAPGRIGVELAFADGRMLELRCAQLEIRGPRS
jgi:hypothetical protein